MLTGLSDAAAGMTASRQAYELISENLAHLSVPGYRRHEISMEAVLDEQTSTERQHLSGPQIAETATDFTSGPLQYTTNPTDVAVLGEGFFAVRGPNGEELYTRNGAFSLNGEGQLVTQAGMPVLGGSGPISLGTDASTQTLEIDASGNVTVGAQSVGKLKLVTFADTSLLRRVGSTLFGAAPNQAPTTEGVSIQQGVREMANVSAVTELVSLVTAMRHYEAAQRAMKAINEAIQHNTTPGNG